MVEIRHSGKSMDQRIADRLKAWKDSQVKTLLIGTGSIDAVSTLAELCA